MPEFTQSQLYGPYMGHFGDRIITRRGIEFKIFGFTAYSAGGLIGSEYNGIAVFCQKPRMVCTDKVACKNSSYSPGFEREILAELDRLEKLPEDIFLQFVAHSPEVRGDAKKMCLRALGVLPPERRWTPRQRLQELADFMEGKIPTSYELDNKERFARHALTLARRFIRAACLPPSVKASFNAGGIAVSGEVWITVHGKVVAEISCSSMRRAEIRYTPSTRGANNYISINALLREVDPRKFEQLRDFFHGVVYPKLSTPCSV